MSHSGGCCSRAPEPVRARRELRESRAHARRGSRLPRRWPDDELVHPGRAVARSTRRSGMRMPERPQQRDSLQRGRSLEMIVSASVTSLRISISRAPRRASFGASTSCSGRSSACCRPGPCVRCAMPRVAPRGTASRASCSRARAGARGTAVHAKAQASSMFCGVVSKTALLTWSTSSPLNSRNRSASSPRAGGNPSESAISTAQAVETSIWAKFVSALHPSIRTAAQVQPWTSQPRRAASAAPGPRAARHVWHRRPRCRRLSGSRRARSPRVATDAAPQHSHACGFGIVSRSSRRANRADGVRVATVARRAVTDGRSAWRRSARMSPIRNWLA